RVLVLFQPAPLQAGPGRRLLGPAKFSTKSRTARIAVLSTFPGFFRRFRKREPHPRAGGAQQKPYNERTRWCMRDQDPEPGRALPKRMQWIHAGLPGSTEPRTGAAAKPP